MNPGSENTPPTSGTVYAHEKAAGAPPMF